jgi:hypothetical protein
VNENLIEKARIKAIGLNRSLNDLFIEWLKVFSSDTHTSLNYKKYLSKYSHIKMGKKYTREEMNER